MSWEAVGALHGAGLSTLELVAANALSEGDPLVLRDDGKVMKKTGLTNTVPVKYLALADAVAGANVLVKPLTPETIVSLGYESGAAAGGQYGLAADLTIDKDNTTQKMVEVLSLDARKTGYADCVNLGWRSATAPVDTDVTSLSAAVGDTQSVVTWTDPATTDVDHILLYVTDAGVGITGSPFTVAAAAETKTVTGLTNGTEYTVVAKAVDSDGNVSPGVTDTVTPSA